MSPRPLIVDCDPGHDDAVALFLALGNPALDLRFVTTVGGNQTIDKVTFNARALLAQCHREDIPVYRGAERPLLRPVQTAGDIHGDTGLDGVDLPEPTVPERDTPAAQAIAEAVMAAPPGELTLVATGPLTNLALAVRLVPQIVERVREVVVMGGAYQGGNVTAAAEFNIACDPEAAHIVFEQDWPLTMVGLDLTHQALATPSVEDRLLALNTDLARCVLGLMSFFRAAYRDVQGFQDPPVHDPCTLAYLIDPTIVATRKAPIMIETAGRHTAGMTVVDLRGPAPADCRTQVATTLDVDRFWDLVIAAITRLGGGDE